MTRVAVLLLLAAVAGCAFKPQIPTPQECQTERIPDVKNLCKHADFDQCMEYLEFRRNFCHEIHKN
jgi:hypothetical protein